MPQIISASRRTDIPAFFVEELMTCLDKGEVQVKNPYNPKQLSRIDLSPEQVDAIVFWTKNPAPLLPRLSEIDSRGYRYYFQFTLNAYPDELEPGVPSLAERIETLRKLAGIIGPGRVVWRYDPIILSNRTGTDHHRRVFADLCDQLGGSTRRVMVSLVDYYRKTIKNLKPLEQSGWVFNHDALNRPSSLELLAELARTAAGHGIAAFTCAEEQDFTDLGLRPGACIDGELIREIFGIERDWKKDPGQRKACRCVVSRDIGSFDTCRHGCPYCYATRNPATTVTC